MRQYQNKKLDSDAVVRLEEEIQAVNREGGLHVQLILDEPKAFEGGMAKYGSFSGVTNYIAMIGRKSSNLDEKCGYYGERLVLPAQQLGLNTCWSPLPHERTVVIKWICRRESSGR